MEFSLTRLKVSEEYFINCPSFTIEDQGDTTMLKEEDLPEHILAALKPYQKKTDKGAFDLFPCQIFCDDNYYYYFMFPPATEHLVIRDDGVVPPVEQIKTVQYTAISSINSADSIMAERDDWAAPSVKEKYQDLLQLLKKIKEQIGDKAPSQIMKDMDAFIEETEAIIREQDTLCEALENGIDLMAHTNDIKVTTPEDCKQLRQYLRDAIRAHHNQGEIELKTEKVRARVMGYLSSHKGMNPKLWIYDKKLKDYCRPLVTWDKMVPEARQDRAEIGEWLEQEDTPFEKTSAAPESLEYLRNPRT